MLQARIGLISHLRTHRVNQTWHHHHRRSYGHHRKRWTNNNYLIECRVRCKSMHIDIYFTVVLLKLFKGSNSLSWAKASRGSTRWPCPVGTASVGCSMCCDDVCHICNLVSSDYITFRKPSIMCVVFLLIAWLLSHCYMTECLLFHSQMRCYVIVFILRSIVVLCPWGRELMTGCLFTWRPGPKTVKK